MMESHIPQALKEGAKLMDTAGVHCHGGFTKPINQQVGLVQHQCRAAVEALASRVLS